MPRPVSLRETAVSRTSMSCNRRRGFDGCSILLHNSDQTFRPCVCCRTTTPAGWGPMSPQANPCPPPCCICTSATRLPWTKARFRGSEEEEEGIERKKKRVSEGGGERGRETEHRVTERALHSSRPALLPSLGHRREYGHIRTPFLLSNQQVLALAAFPPPPGSLSTRQPARHCNAIPALCVAWSLSGHKSDQPHAGGKSFTAWLRSAIDTTRLIDTVPFPSSNPRVASHIVVVCLSSRKRR